jgi:N,N'-diacetyllegionaminate synthase
MIEIIAEAAQGFLGAPREKTLLLARFAAAARADAVKFQLVYADELCTPDYKHYTLFGALEMTDSEWLQLGELCRSLGLALYVDVFGLRSLALAQRVGVAGVKIHSTDMMNIGLLRSLAASDVKRVILSTGGCLMPEIERAVAMVGQKPLVLMHGFQGYPTASDENQIARIALLRAKFPETTIGFADHVPESDASRLWLAAAAVGAGVQVIEKHITTAAVCKDEDYESALAPDEFAQFAANMRLASSAYGSAQASTDFGMSEREKTYRRNMKKQVVAARDLPAGALLKDEDLALKRTSSEADVLYELTEAVGKRIGSAVSAGRALLRTMLQ